MTPPCRARLWTEAGDSCCRYVSSTVHRYRLAATCNLMGSVIAIVKCRPRSSYWPLSLSDRHGESAPRHSEGLKRVGDLAILSYEDTKAKDKIRRSLWEPSSNSSNDATLIFPHAGIAPNALRSSISIAICKPRVSPSVKRPRHLRCPAARFRHGGPTKRASTSIPPWSPFFTVARGLPSCIAWFSGYIWCAPKWGRVAFVWCACSCHSRAYICSVE